MYLLESFNGERTSHSNRAHTFSSWATLWPAWACRMKATHLPSGADGTSSNVFHCLSLRPKSRWIQWIQCVGILFYAQTLVASCSFSFERILLNIMYWLDSSLVTVDGRFLQSLKHGNRLATPSTPTENTCSMRYDHCAWTFLQFSHHSWIRWNTPGKRGQPTLNQVDMNHERSRIELVITSKRRTQVGHESKPLLAAAPLIPSCFSKVLAGLESQSTWNFTLNYSTHLFFSEAVLLRLNPPGKTSSPNIVVISIISIIRLTLHFVSPVVCQWTWFTYRKGTSTLW